jgi:hypothetical protein
MGKESLDGLLVGGRTGLFPKGGDHIRDVLSQDCRKLGLVGISNTLQRGNVHDELL